MCFYFLTFPHERYVVVLYPRPPGRVLVWVDEDAALTTGNQVLGAETVLNAN